jgi:hypothetical protein
MRPPAVDMVDDDRLPESGSTFHFLDLPKEIRFMIYERPPRTANHTTTIARDTDVDNTMNAPSLNLNSHSTSTGILGTCRQIHLEALSLGNATNNERTITDWIEISSFKIILQVGERNGALRVAVRVMGIILQRPEDEQEDEKNTGSALKRNCRLRTSIEQSGRQS